MSIDGARSCAGRTAIFLALLLPVLIFLAAGGMAVRASAQESASNANRQFVQAMQMIQQANATFDSTEEARLLRDADRLLNEIVQRYPDSAIAVQLITNQFIGDFDVFEFHNRVRALICNDAQATACFLYRIENLLPPVEYPVSTPRWDWLSLAVALALRRRRLRHLRLCRALLIECDEIDGIEQERREATVAHCGCHDLARKREQQARALDHDERLQCLRRYVLDAKDAGEGQVERKQNGAGVLGLAFEIERDLIIGLGELLDGDIDLNVDGGLRLRRRQRARRVRIFER